MNVKKGLTNISCSPTVEHTLVEFLNNKNGKIKVNLSPLSNKKPAMTTRSKVNLKELLTCRMAKNICSLLLLSSDSG